MKLEQANLITQPKAVSLSIKVFKPNMLLQFEPLIGKNNLEHMFLAVHNDEVVSMVNYYPSILKLNHLELKVASIGSVCTDSHYRGQNLASQLLELSLVQMKKEKIDLIIISGDLGIYQRFGARQTGILLKYNLTKLDFNPHKVTLRKYIASDLVILHQLYQNEPIRHDRTLLEFESLLSGKSSPDYNTEYPLYVILEDEKVVGYIMCNVDINGDHVSIKELAGKRDTIYQALSNLLSTLNKEKLTIELKPSDPLNTYLPKDKSSIIPQSGTYKLVDPKLFLDKMIPYFKTYNKVFTYQIQEGIYSLNIDGIEFTLKEVELVTFFFGSIENLNNSKLSGILPIELPFNEDMNYQ